MEISWLLVQIWKLFCANGCVYWCRQLSLCRDVLRLIESTCIHLLQYTSRKLVHTLDLFRLDVMLNKILNAMQKYWQCLKMLKYKRYAMSKQCAMPQPQTVRNLPDNMTHNFFKIRPLPIRVIFHALSTLKQKIITNIFLRLRLRFMYFVKTGNSKQRQGLAIAEVGF